MAFSAIKEYQSPQLRCGACEHDSSDFSEINLVLSDSVVKVDVTGEEGVQTDKALKMYVCPKCGTVQIPELIQR